MESGLLTKSVGMMSLWIWKDLACRKRMHRSGTNEGDLSMVHHIINVIARNSVSGIQNMPHSFFRDSSIGALHFGWGFPTASVLSHWIYAYHLIGDCDHGLLDSRGQLHHAHNPALLAICRPSGCTVVYGVVVVVVGVCNHSQ